MYRINDQGGGKNDETGMRSDFVGHTSCICIQWVWDRSDTLSIHSTQPIFSTRYKPNMHGITLRDGSTGTNT